MSRKCDIDVPASATGIGRYRAMFRQPFNRLNFPSLSYSGLIANSFSWNLRSGSAGPRARAVHCDSHGIAFAMNHLGPLFGLVHTLQRMSARALSTRAWSATHVVPLAGLVLESGDDCLDGFSGRKVFGGLLDLASKVQGREVAIRAIWRNNIQRGVSHRRGSTAPLYQSVNLPRACISFSLLYTLGNSAFT